MSAKPDFARWLGKPHDNALHIAKRIASVQAECAGSSFSDAECISMAQKIIPEIYELATEMQDTINLAKQLET